ncbi:Uncharacterized conserved protein [Anoxybacillus flavithermus WK1]|jgi:hypothetical protein|nr:Uncharacterized conserved protein [Anoxybacillus flavithermus WK1]
MEAMIMNDYEILFQKYVKELKEAIEEEKEFLDPNLDKERYEYELSISGRVIAVFRKYWFECDKLNDNEENEYYVNPKDFCVDWLSGEHEELFRIIEKMPYYPIGIDEHGNYV